MNAELQIRTKLEQFLKAWEGELELIDECVDDEPYAYFSIFGYGYVKGDIRRWLSMRGKTSTLTLKIINDSVLVKGDEAIQYANVIGIFKDNAYYQKHLAIGGTFVNQLNKTENGWKLKKIRFDLRCEDSVGKTSLSREGMLYRETGFGQWAFAQNWLKIDDRIGHNMSAIPGIGDRMISADYDTPWYVIKDQDNALDDEAQIKELMYKYCYAFDFATFPLLTDVLDDDIQYTYDGNSWNNKRDTIGFLKMYRKVTPRSFHAVEFEDICINDEEACVSARRIAPDLRTKRYIDDDFEQWIDGVYRYKAVKKDSKWVITEFSYDRV